MYIYIYECLFIPTFYLSFFLAYTLTLFSGILPGICSNILSGIYADLLSGIYSDILSDMLSGIYSSILSGTTSGIHLASILTLLLTWAQPDLKCERQISVDNASWAPISGACRYGEYRRFFRPSTNETDVENPEMKRDSKFGSTIHPYLGVNIHSPGTAVPWCLIMFALTLPFTSLHIPIRNVNLLRKYELVQELDLCTVETFAGTF